MHNQRSEEWGGIYSPRKKRRRALLSKEEKEKGIQLTIHLLLMPRLRG
jgi:hypothetical protein